MGFGVKGLRPYGLFAAFGGGVAFGVVSLGQG